MTPSRVVVPYWSSNLGFPAGRLPALGDTRCSADGHMLMSEFSSRGQQQHSASSLGTLLSSLLPLPTKMLHVYDLIWLVFLQTTVEAQQR